MPNVSSKTRLVCLRIPNALYDEYSRLVNGERNPHETPGLMMKWVLEWYPFRHTTRKYRQKMS